MVTQEIGCYHCLGQSGTPQGCEVPAFRACPLSQGAAQAFDVVRFTATFAYSFMAFTREYLGVRLPEVGVEHGALPVVSRQRSPKSHCSCFASAADKHADDFSGRGVQG